MKTINIYVVYSVKYFCLSESFTDMAGARQEVGVSQAYIDDLYTLLL